MQKKDKEIFLILGMHRSGTSVMTKFLEIFNINIGSDFSPPRVDNPTGFYEDMSFLRVNINLLKLNKINWNSILNPLNLNLKTKSININFWLSDIKQKIKFKDNFAFKDPRSILFINFWNNFFKKKNYNVRYLYCYRHPYLISNSIIKRDKIKREDVFLLILQNWYLILKNIKNNDNKIFLNYDLLISNNKKLYEKFKKQFHLNSNNDKYLFFKKEILLKNNKKFKSKNNQVYEILLKIYHYFNKPKKKFKSKDNQVYEILLKIYHYFNKPKKSELLNLIKKIEKYYENQM